MREKQRERETERKGTEGMEREKVQGGKPARSQREGLPAEALSFLHYFWGPPRSWVLPCQAPHLGDKLDWVIWDNSHTVQRNVSFFPDWKGLWLWGFPETFSAPLPPCLPAAGNKESRGDCSEERGSLVLLVTQFYCKRQEHLPNRDRSHFWHWRLHPNTKPPPLSSLSPPPHTSLLHHLTA